MKVQQQSLLFLHLSVLLFGGTALFSKLIALPAIDITVYRTAIAALVLLILLVIGKKNIKLQNPKDYAIAIMLGMVVGIHWVTYFASMQMASVTVGIIAFFLSGDHRFFRAPL